jgi:hypothetical protein
MWSFDFTSSRSQELHAPLAKVLVPALEPVLRGGWPRRRAALGEPHGSLFEVAVLLVVLLVVLRLVWRGRRLRRGRARKVRVPAAPDRGRVDLPRRGPHRRPRGRCSVQSSNSKFKIIFFFFFFLCVCVCENSELVNPSQKNPDDCPKTQCIAPRTRVLDRASAPQRPRAEAGPQRTRRPGGSARQDRPRAWSAPSRPLAAADPQGCGLIKVVRFLGWQYGLVQHHHRDRDTGLVARLSTRGNLENGKKKKHAH